MKNAGRQGQALVLGNDTFSFLAVASGADFPWFLYRYRVHSETTFLSSFKGLVPRPAQVPESVWINPPIEEIAKPEIIIHSPLNTSSFVSQSH